MDISAEHAQVFAYTRSFGDATALVILNFGVEEASFSLDNKQDWSGFDFVLGNYLEAESDLKLVGSNLVLVKGYEGRLYIRAS